MNTLTKGCLHHCLMAMTKSFVCLSTMLSLAISLSADPDFPSISKEKLTYPVAPPGTQTDVYHGISVADPYRYLENPKSSETQAWIQAQNQFTQSYFEQIPARNKIRSQLKALWNYDRYGLFFKRGSRYFFWKNSGEQKHSILYMLSILSGTPKVVLDPNLFSLDGSVSVQNLDISPNGDVMAYSTTQSGSDWAEWHLRNIITGQDLKETLKWTKGEDISFTKNGRGIFYTRYVEPEQGKEHQQVNSHVMLYYHELGADPAEDMLVYERPDKPTWLIYQKVTEDGRYLIVNIHDGSDKKNRLYYKDLTTGHVGDGNLIPLIDKAEAEVSFIENEGSHLYLMTTHLAPHGRVMQVDVQKPKKLSFIQVIPESSDVIANVHLHHHQLIVQYKKDAQAKIFNLKGQLQRRITLPSSNLIYSSKNDKEGFYRVANFTTPSSIYRYDLKTEKTTLLFQSKLSLASNHYVTEKASFLSKDGTQISMVFIYKKGLIRDGKNPTYLLGYGGFGRSISLSFSPQMALWIEMGGIYAVPNLRGGGEYGEEWHQAGARLNKQNTFDDFIAAAKWLIDQHYTSPEKLAIYGNSHGGLVVGACLTQHPELFGAAVAKAGLFDMLRVEQFTAGKYWIPEFGTVEDPDDFAALYAYSPLHRVKSGTRYPAVLIKTADHDDRVVPSHSYKFTATLQAAQAGPAPILLRIEQKAGHNLNLLSKDQLLEAATDELAFLSRELHIEPPA